MVGLMMPNVSDAVLADICKVVMAEKCRREPLRPNSSVGPNGPLDG
jgi:hypothetical protein